MNSGNGGHGDRYDSDNNGYFSIGYDDDDVVNYDNGCD